MYGRKRIRSSSVLLSSSLWLLFASSSLLIFAIARGEHRNQQNHHRQQHQQQGQRKSQQVNEGLSSIDEKLILNLLYVSCGGEQWKESTGWNGSDPDLPVCSWYGVECSSSSNSDGDRAIVSIALPDNHLQGSLPSQLYQLPALTHLDLSNNMLVDSGFSQSADIDSPLQKLDLSGNLLTEVTGLGGSNTKRNSLLSETLVDLRLVRNQLVNGFPETLTELTSLEKLYLQYTGMRGTLPTAVGQLSALQDLYMDSNQISGTLPTELGQLDQLQILSMGDNLWKGTIPTQFENLINLRILNLYGHENDGKKEKDIGQLTGTLPNFDRIPNLSKLTLAKNALTGSISDKFLHSIWDTDKRMTINLQENKLSGTVPASLDRFKSLTLLIQGNQLTGPLPGSFCSMKKWMHGLVELYGCAAIACPTGTFNTLGQQVSEHEPCQPCPTSNAGLDDSLHTSIGSKHCADPGQQRWSQARILAEFYLETDGPNWERNDGWDILDSIHLEDVKNGHVNLSNLQVCSFYGIICGTTAGDVEVITLTNNLLDGTVPTRIWQLEKLSSFDLSYNDIDIAGLQNQEDEFFSAVESATNLAALKLSHTGVTNLKGIGQTVQLKELFLDGNQFTTTLPTEIGLLTQLSRLHLEQSYLGGTIPSEFAKLTNLKRLTLQGNRLRGTIPEFLAINMTKLEFLDLSNNNFKGVLTAPWSSMPSIKSLRISRATGGLGGTFPTFHAVQHLEELDLSYNTFSGTIPPNFLAGVTSKDREVTVRLTLNDLTGKVPESLGKFQRLILELQNNFISELPVSLCGQREWMKGRVGTVSDADQNGCNAIMCPPQTWSPLGYATTTGADATACLPCTGNIYYGETGCEQDHSFVTRTTETIILDELFEATGGRYWSKPHINWTKPGIPICQREGVVCNSKETPNEGVTALHLTDYGLMGTVPESIFELPSLRILGLSFNEIDLSLKNIAKAQTLEALLLSDTQVKSLNGLENANIKLAGVHFAKNNWQGTFPKQFLQMKGLKNLFLNENKFSGTIPSELSTLNLQTVSFWNNEFVGSLPSSLATMTDLKVLLLHDNYLSGLVPAEFNDLSSLTEVDLSNQLSENKFSGDIPAFSKAIGLASINLSRNDFTGTIPQDLLIAVEDKTVEIKIDLSFNNILGSIPVSLESFQKLDINLAGNQIGNISASFCEMSDWMAGNVGLFSNISETTEQKCQAILCPPGTALKQGRQVSADEPCKECPTDEVALYYGSTACKGIDERNERAALTNFYHAMDGDHWIHKNGWLRNEVSVCDWYGITCKAGLVVAINLANNKLRSEGGLVVTIDLVINKHQSKATLEKDHKGPLLILSALSNLKDLNLMGNHLTELDFSSAGSSLSSIRLSGCDLQSLEGIGRVSNLEVFHAADNGLRGQLPPELYTLTELRELFLSSNSLTGTLSPGISDLHLLEKLYLWDNLLTGTLPLELGSPENLRLREVALGRNLFVGSIPSQVSSLPALEQFSAQEQKGYDKISGTLLDFANAPNLWYLDLSNNDISGSIPGNFLKENVNTDTEITLLLQKNHITGNIPVELQRFEALEINLAGNEISGIAEELCTKKAWNNGDVGAVGNCNAILCPRGSYSDSGRQVAANTSCLPCDYEEDQQFLGQTNCHSASITERGILEKIFTETTGEQWTSKEAWMSTEPICSWAGVRCKGPFTDDLGVVGLDLQYNNMQGTLPTEIWALPSLKEVLLGENRVLTVSFEGIERAAGSLTSLSLYDTIIYSLDGISGANNLKSLQVTGLTGTFPSELFQLNKTIEELFLSDNFFVGTLPDEIGELTALRSFHAVGSDLHGKLPSRIGELSKLEELVLNDNLFSGELPVDGISSLRGLKRFEVSRRVKVAGPKFSGPLPAFDQMPELEVLTLANNDFFGGIHQKFLNNSQSIYIVDLRHNRLSGAVPERLASLPTLVLLLAGNEISFLSQDFCDNNDWMAGIVGKVGNNGCNAILCPPHTSSPLGRSNETVRCTSCPSNNETSTPAPYFGSTTCAAPVSERDVLLELFEACKGNDWHRNDFWNSPIDFCDWYGVGCDINGHVVVLNLAANNLRGTTPPSIFDLPYLQILYIHSNPIDFIFDNIENARNLLDLRLGSTGLTTLQGVGNAKSLTFLDVSFNALAGKFPEELLQLKNLRVLDIGENSFSGPLPTSFGSLPYLRVLQSYSNEFTGTLPSFNDSRVLHKIYFARNNLTGTIPIDFLNGISKNTNLTVDLSHNYLTGAIPKELGRFDDMAIYLRMNQIEELPAILCSKSKWNGGDVGVYGCDAILCSPGYTTDIGRQSSSTAGCVQCYQANERFYGQSDCPSHSVDQESSAFGGFARRTLPTTILAAAFILSQFQYQLL